MLYSWTNLQAVLLIQFSIPFVLVVNQSPARQKRVKMRWEQSMVPNDTSAWKDTKGFGGSLKLRWSVLILGKVYQFRSTLALACVSGKWTFASWMLLQRAAKVFQSNVHFSAGLGRPVGLFGTLQVRPQTFISMRALKTLPALPPNSFQVPTACGTFSFCHVMLLCPSMLLCLQTRRPEAASVLGSCRSFDKFRPPIAYR